jgi:photosystem II stability/assembly factor-like uncharacterized protein
VVHHILIAVRLGVILSAATALGQSWTAQQSTTTSSLRGVSAVNAKIVWASGNKGTFLRTLDGGSTWHAASVPGAADLDFRAVRAFDQDRAFLLSIGPGEKSRVYKTVDGGARWSVMFTNPDTKGFFDALQFWDDTHGILLGDPVDGRFTIFTTDDAGATWKRRTAPAASAEEGAFAASNSCLFVSGTREAWFASGGRGGARVFHSGDGGGTWTAAKTPVRNDSPNAGVFSLYFSGARGIAVGGDYSKIDEPAGNVSLSVDGGKMWAASPDASPGGFRSAVVYVGDRKAWIATGTSGSDISIDGGRTWKQFDRSNFNALSFVSGDAGWAVGPQGNIARFVWEKRE